MDGQATVVSEKAHLGLQASLRERRDSDPLANAYALFQSAMQRPIHSLLPLLLVTHFALAAADGKTIRIEIFSHASPAALFRNGP